MGGYGQNLYKYLVQTITLTRTEFERVWNERIYPDRLLRDMFNGIWCKIAFQEELFDVIIKDLIERSVAASYTARSAGVFTLISCIDAIAGEKYQDFYPWLRANHRALQYTRRELARYYNDEYIPECGGMRNFRTAFENLIELGFINNYHIYFHRRAGNLVNLSQSERGNIMSEAQRNFSDMTDIDKAHIIARFFYNFYRNPFVHQGINPAHDPPEWALDAMGIDRNASYALPLFPEIDLLGGHIEGDVGHHLRELVKITLAQKFVEIHQQLLMQR